MLPASLREKYLSLPKEILAMDDKELEASFQFTKTDRLLRISIWNEVEKAAKLQLPKVTVTKIVDGICTQENYALQIKNPLKVAFYMRQPKSYEAQVNELIDVGVAKLRESFDAKIVYSNGHLDARAAKTLLDILAYFEARTKGAIEQKLKLDAKMQNSNANITVNITSGPELDEKLNALRQKLANYEDVGLVHTLPARAVKDISEDDV